MKISVSAYSFHQYVKAGKLTQLDCVAKAKEIGFDAIEFTDIIANSPEEQRERAAAIAAEAKRLGMDINAYTIGANLCKETDEENEKEVERLKGQLEIAKLLGAKVMRHDVCYSLTKSGRGRSFDLMLPTIAKNAREVTAYAESLGIRTCTENHGRIAQDSDRVERLFNAVDHDNYGLLVDVGNFLCVDEDPIRAVSKVAPYAVHAHVKDFQFSAEPSAGFPIVTRGGNFLRGCAVGEGIVPVRQCLRILKNAGYTEYVSIEYEGAEDCLVGIAKGFANLKAFMASEGL